MWTPTGADADNISLGMGPVDMWVALLNPELKV
jgi:hypothetical protein